MTTETDIEITSTDIEVTVERSYQGVTLWLGDGFPVTIGDDTNATDVLDLVQVPIQRAVAVARLRAIADTLAGD